jgi:hypothetical protein
LNVNLLCMVFLNDKTFFLFDDGLEIIQEEWS